MLAMDNKVAVLTVKIEDSESENMDTNEDNKTYTEYPYAASMPLLKLENVIAGNPLANIADEVEPGEIEEAEEAIEDSVTVEERSLVFQIKFEDKNNFQLYMHKVVTALETALNVDEQGRKFEFSIEDSAEENTTDKEQYLVRGFIVKNHRNQDQQQCSVVHQETIEPKDSANREESPDLDLASLFTIDTSGSEKLNTDAVPSYKRVIKDYLDEDSIECKRKKQEKKADFSAKRPATACFNCGATNHSMRECPKPRNKTRINRNISAKKLERYHIDVKQKFGHLRPGEISDKTRFAMGLKNGEIPFFFYNMRELGYPPGWLQDAKVVNSGISLFDSEGQAVNNNLGNEGTNEDKYDESKIISFPGFNMDPGPNFFDDFKYHNVPPMNQRQMKEEFIKILGDKVVRGYKRRKLKSLPSTSTAELESNANRLNVTDMEIEEVDLNSESTASFCRPPLPATSSEEDTVLPPLPPTSPPESPERKLSQSPTLADLEQRKKKLLAELTGEVTEADVPETQNTIKELRSTPIDINFSTPGERSASSPSSATLSTPTANGNKRCDDIRESHMGTPILQFSPFDKLPIGDNFKVGVSDVINFENLPDSTGKYEQMKDVIKKVRRVITELQDDE